MKNYIKTLGILLVFGLFFIPHVVEAVTFLETREITEDVVWTKEKSPYVLPSSLSVKEGAKLTIEPGVIVKFAQNTSLNINGVLKVNGLVSDKVIFTSLYNDAVGGDSNNDGVATGVSNRVDWGISIYNSVATSTIENAHFSYSSSTAISAFGGRVSVNEVTIDQFSVGILASDYSGPVGGVVSGTNIIMRDIAQNPIMSRGNPIVNLSYVTIGGEKENDSIMMIQNSTNLAIDNLIVKNVKSQNGIWIYNDSKVSIVNSTFENVRAKNGLVNAVNNSELKISNTVFKNIPHLHVLGIANIAKVHLSNTTLMGGLEGVSVFATDRGSLTIASSSISEFSKSGISIRSSVPTTISKSVITKNAIGIEIPIRTNETKNLSVFESSIFDNAVGVVNNDSWSISLVNNWWGDSTGPYHESLNPGGKGNGIKGVAQFTPWLEKDPLTDEIVCCSSVVFIPGLKASRLYKDSVGVFGTSTNMLWEPNWSTDVKALFLDEGGKSVSGDVYTKDIIDSLLFENGKKVYGSFIDHMDSLVKSEEIKEWETFPYDWRLGFKETINSEINIDNSMYSMVERIKLIAKESKTGKVTIVSHSNGGLVSKELVNVLEKSGNAELLDKLVLISVPQFGTPYSIATLLHGYDQMIAGGFILNEETARLWSENMRSVYNLLPSVKYFEKLNNQLVIFDSSLSQVNNNLSLFYGNSISDYSELKNFLSGSEGRVKPHFSNLTEPNVLRSTWISDAQDAHTNIDNWAPPASLKVVQLAGVGLDTLAGIKYKAKKCGVFNIGSCKFTLDYEPVFTTEGDGVVVATSALDDTEGFESYFIDLNKYNFENTTNVAHGYIFEIPDVVKFLSDQISNRQSDYEYISLSKPVNKRSESVQISIHSPVNISLHDLNGNSTGSIGSITNGMFSSFNSQIPNSSYHKFGEGKYIVSDYKDGFKLEIKGEGVGVFTLNTSFYNDNRLLARTSYKNIPVSEKLQGTMMITPAASLLNLDIDGDGLDDVSLSSDESLAPSTYFEILKRTILTLDLEEKHLRYLAMKIDKVIKLLGKENGKDPDLSKLDNLIEKLGNGKWGNTLDNEERNNLVLLLSDALNGF